MTAIGQRWIPFATLLLLAWGGSRLGAATIEFGTTGSWSTATNWMGGVVPGSADTANIDRGLAATLSSGSPTVANLNLGTANGTGQLTIAGGALSSPGNVYIANGGNATLSLTSGSLSGWLIDLSNNGNAQVTISGGTLASTASNMRIGTSSFSTGGLTTLTQTGGTVSSASGIMLGGTSLSGPATASTYTLSGGTLTWGSTLTLAGGATLTVNSQHPTISGTLVAGVTDGFKVIAAAGQSNAVVKFVLGAHGVSPINLPTSYLNLGTNATLVIDGSAYITPVNTSIPLFNFRGYDSGVTQSFNQVQITGFPWHTATLVYNPTSIVLRLIAKTKPVVGAIRWDAWVGGTGQVYEAVLTTLGPSTWHYRLPFFGAVTGTNSVTVDGSNWATTDQEIFDASRAGLSYWAFCTYLPSSYASSSPRTCDMAIPLHNYLASAYRTSINFCMILDATSNPQADYKSYVESLMVQSGYQTVLGGRPLLYLLNANGTTVTNNWGGNMANLAAWINGIRTDIMAAGKPNPYIVIMDPDATSGSTWCTNLACDAIGAYSTTGNSDGTAGGLSGAPYASLVSGVEWFWGQCLASGHQVVPLIKVGSDNRPRVQNPPPFEPNPGAMNHFWQAATPAQIQSHATDAINWLSTNSTHAQAQISLIYAWNEFDEGGYICPTLTGGTSLLDAVTAAIQASSH